MYDDRRKLVEAILARYHTTRISGGDVVDFVLAGTSVIRAFDAIAKSGARMSDDEILQRARRAVSESYKNDGFSKYAGEVLLGQMDNTPAMQTVICALRGLDKPLEPPVDPVLLKCREILASDTGDLRRAYKLSGDADDSPEMRAVRAAYEAGKADAA